MDKTMWPWKHPDQCGASWCEGHSHCVYPWSQGQRAQQTPNEKNQALSFPHFRTEDTIIQYKNINPNLIALLISSYHAHSLDEGVSRVVHTSLDGLVQGPVVGGCLVPQVCINGWGHCRCHAVVVLPQVRVISTVEIDQKLHFITSRAVFIAYSLTLPIYF